MIARARILDRRSSSMPRRRARVLATLGSFLAIVSIAAASAHDWPRHAAGFASIAVAPDWKPNEVAQGVRIDAPGGTFEAALWLRLYPGDDLADDRARGFVVTRIGDIEWLALRREAEGMQETSLVAGGAQGLVQVVTNAPLDDEARRAEALSVMVESIRLSP